MASMVRSEERAETRARSSSRGSYNGSWDPTKLRRPIDSDRVSSLSSLIEGEIIPRLVVAHSVAAPTIVPTDGDHAITIAEIEELAPLALQVEADALLAHVESILARGVAFDTVLVDLLAPAARLLGEFWKDDRCDFIDVTMGLWRLQEVVHEISSRMPGDEVHGGAGHHALFATMPGDQHSFGTVVIDELFRRHGWVTDRVSEVENADLLKRVADGWFDLIGLTVTCDCHIAPLASTIAALRNVSRNPRVCVMVGGRIFSDDPDLAVLVGADGTARQADLALKVACKLVRGRGVGTRAL